ncbi:hypothetical protein L873DRAFT_1871072 [Choiromyces venosus 120613-1]|uniref:Uncharacterized protein n=1 Tax=Choiromyces venosus 120613-1 TaxID=1336337 RepID=A0A3N4K0V9_9PEZI|nr:hypothetical protein L873DRAFT_1871072 [Choiromyces venosus 120613-1]
MKVMSSNNPSPSDRSFPLSSTTTVVQPVQGNNVTVKKVLTRDECRLAKMAMEARNANRDLTARIKMDSAFMSYKDAEINVLRVKVESLEHENKQLKRVLEALQAEAGRKKEEAAKKRGGREAREDVAFLSKCVEELDKLSDVSDASESLLSGLPEDPEAAKTYVPRDLGPMLGLSTGLDIRHQSGNWVAKRLQVRKSSNIAIVDNPIGEDPIANRPSKTKTAGESSKNNTTGGVNSPGSQNKFTNGQNLGTVGLIETGMTVVSGTHYPVGPIVSGNGQTTSELTNFLGDLIEDLPEVTNEQPDKKKQNQEISLNLPKQQSRQFGVVGNNIATLPTKTASPKSAQDNILERRQFELCKSFLNDVKKSRIQQSALDSSALTSPQLSPKAFTVLHSVPLETEEHQGCAKPGKDQIERRIGPSEEARLSYNYEHIREVVLYNLPADINYNRLFSCIRGGVVEAVMINMPTQEAKIVFMEPEAARRFYKKLGEDGVWMPGEIGGNRPRRKDGMVRCGLGKFLWTPRSAVPSPEMIANVWDHRKTRCLEFINLTCMTVEAIAKDVIGYLKLGPARGDVIESIFARNAEIDGQYKVVVRFTAINYAIAAHKKMVMDKRYMGCNCIFLPDTCGELTESRPPDIWFDKPKSLRAPNGGAVGKAKESLIPELEEVVRLTPKPGLRNWSKRSSQPNFLGKPGNPRVHSQNVPNGGSAKEMTCQIDVNIHDMERSVLITNLPRDIRYSALFSKIRGGRVEHLQIFEPVTITDSFSALIIFVTPRGAKTYRDFILEWNLMFGERRIIRKDHIPTGLFNIMNILPASTTEAGVTRCICIYNMREMITGEDVKEDLRKAGMSEKLVQWENSNVERSEGDGGVLNIYLRFTSIAGALWARKTLQKLERYEGCVFRHARDPCANGVDELVEARDPVRK